MTATFETAHLEEPTHWVGLYHVERQYGGPEEGGWWYDCFYHVLSIPAWGEDDARQQWSRLQQRTLKPERPLSSMLSDGEARVIFEERPGQYETTEVPHYE